MPPGRTTIRSADGSTSVDRAVGSDGDAVGPGARTRLEAGGRDVLAGPPQDVDDRDRLDFLESRPRVERRRQPFSWDAPLRRRGSDSSNRSFIARARVARSASQPTTPSRYCDVPRTRSIGLDHGVDVAHEPPVHGLDPVPAGMDAHSELEGARPEPEDREDQRRPGTVRRARATPGACARGRRTPRPRPRARPAPDRAAPARPPAPRGSGLPRRTPSRRSPRRATRTRAVRSPSRSPRKSPSSMTARKRPRPTDLAASHASLPGRGADLEGARAEGEEHRDEGDDRQDARDEPGGVRRDRPLRGHEAGRLEERRAGPPQEERTTTWRSRRRASSGRNGPARPFARQRRRPVRLPEETAGSRPRGR